MTTFIPIRSRSRNPLSGHPVCPIEQGRAATTCRQRRSIAVPAPGATRLIESRIVLELQSARGTSVPHTDLLYYPLIGT